MDAILIGYSINILNEDYEWDEERRSKFLIDQSIKLPKSIDNSVWEESYDFMHNIKNEEMMENSIKWRNPDRLIELSGYNTKEENRVLVANYLHYFDCVPVEVWAMNYLAENINPDLFFLGYDVADGGTTSGLSNCGYTTTELKFCRDKFLTYLNEHGLFEDFGIANEFLRYSNSRVPEHCPFYVYSLYTDKPID